MAHGVQVWGGQVAQQHWDGDWDIGPGPIGRALPICLTWLHPVALWGQSQLSGGHVGGEGPGSGEGLEARRQAESLR